MSHKEIELRGVLNPEQFIALSNYLHIHSTSSEQDNKTSYFFILDSDHILKAVYNADGSNSLVLKEGDETKNILHEYSIPIQDKGTNMVKILQHLGFSKMNKVDQTRTNFYYKDSIISLKVTVDRGHHFEIEYNGELIDDNQIIAYLHQLCKELDITPMTSEQIKVKISEINNRHGLH